MADPGEEYDFETDRVFGIIGRILAIDADRRTVYYELRNGGTQAVSTDAADLIGDVGDVIFVSDVSYKVISPELWPAVEDTFVGVVQHVSAEVVALEVGSQTVLVPPSPTLEVKVDTTVEASKSRGPIRVVSSEPLAHFGRSNAVAALLARVKQTDFTASESLDHVGGLDAVIKEVERLVLLPLKSPDLFARLGRNPIKGVLFTGPPGTGKTMVARAIAREVGAAFYNIRGPELSSMWVGESERMLRKIFEDASSEARALIFFDEFDSIAGKRDERSHEASRHLVAQLLTEMDGFARYPNVMVLGATNRVQDIDDALRRPGRFDWEIAFLPPDAAGRLDILTKSSKGVSGVETLDLAEIASATDGWSGADLANVWNQAVVMAASDGRPSVLQEDLVAGFQRAATARARRKGER